LYLVRGSFDVDWLVRNKTNFGINYNFMLYIFCFAIACLGLGFVSAALHKYQKDPSDKHIADALRIARVSD
jgi:hypothetical protein